MKDFVDESFDIIYDWPSAYLSFGRYEVRFPEDLSHMNAVRETPRV